MPIILVLVFELVTKISLLSRPDTQQLCWSRPMHCHWALLQLCFSSIFMPLSVISYWRHSVSEMSVCPSVSDSMWSHCKSLWTLCLTNRWWKSHHIYNLGAIGDNSELIRIRGRGYDNAKMVIIHLFKNASFHWSHTSWWFVIEHCPFFYYHIIFFYYPRPSLRTKRYCSAVSYALLNFH